MSVANAASRRVAERLGLTCEGIRRRALRIADEQHDAHVFVAFPEDLARLQGE
ncbi:MAG: GNAT family N-acetyltransferase [Actinomycetota bacterium]|nr:GNAT family N-acetyltransferase [Actinomycetota bacterium]